MKSTLAVILLLLLTACGVTVEPGKGAIDFAYVPKDATVLIDGREVDESWILPTAPHLLEGYVRGELYSGMYTLTLETADASASWEFLVHDGQVTGGSFHLEPE